MIAAIFATAALSGTWSGVQNPPYPPPVQMAPAPPTRGVCERNPLAAVGPEALAERFNEVGAGEYPEHRQAAMAALLTPEAILFNGHENLTLTSEDFLALLGMGRGGALESETVLVSGGTLVRRSPLGDGREIITVIRIEGGCIATVATFYD